MCYVMLYLMLLCLLCYYYVVVSRAEYDNDSFIIDDDGANKEGDLTDSADASAADKNDSKVRQE